jgi:hypothetical protein
MHLRQIAITTLYCRGSSLKGLGMFGCPRLVAPQLTVVR